MDKYSKILIDIIKAWYRYVIFIGLGFFALFAVSKLLFIVNVDLIDRKELQILILFSTAVFIMSYLMYLRFPLRFPCHNINWSAKMLNELWKDGLNRVNVWGGVIIIFIFSPISIFLKSISLSLFVFTFIKPEFLLAWREIFASSENEYIFLSKVLVIPFIWLLLGIGLPIIVTLRYYGPDKRKLFSEPPLLLYFTLFAVITSAFLNFSNGYLIKEIWDIILYSSSQFLKLIIGFIPIGWFYELFIKSIISAEKKKKIIFDF